MQVSNLKRSRLYLLQVFWRIFTVLRLFIGMAIAITWSSLWLKNEGDSERTEHMRQAIYRKQAIRFRIFAENLGGLVIKVGQFLSSRVDFLPKPFIEELQTLQDNVKSAPWREIEPILEETYGSLDQVFITFNHNPIAAASLGQVYKAELKSGEIVAVKVQRPYIEQIVLADLKALTIVVGILSRFTQFGKTFDLFTVLREFRRVVKEELNYRQEIQNTESIRRILRPLPFVHTPQVYLEYSSNKVLVMEFWTGIKINQKDRLLENGIAPRLVAERVIHLYLFMVMEMGHYHADPHPGNILVKDDGTLVLLDYGMVGSLDPTTKRHLRQLFIGVAERSASIIVDSLWSLGMIRPRANRSQLKYQVNYLLERYYAETLNDLAGLNIPVLLRDFESLLHNDAIQVPGEFVHLGRAIAIVVGLSTGLDPEINIVELFAPYAKRFVTEDRGGITGYSLWRAQKWSRNIMELPELSHRFLKQIEEGQLETKIQWVDGDSHIQSLRHAIRRVAQALYVVGFTVTGALLFNHHPIVSNIFWGLALLLILVNTIFFRF